METRVFNGYFQFWDENEGQWIFTHIRAMENKLGRSIPSNRVVHHIDGDKQNNRHENLVAITRGIHGRIHGRHPNACFRCGHDNHKVAECYARYDYAQQSIDDWFLRR